MKISLFQGILLGVFGIGALLGLFAFSTYNSKGTQSGPGTVVIWGELPAEGFNSMLTTLGQTNKDLKGVTYHEHDGATIKNDLTTAIATGHAPDLVLISQEDVHSLVPVLQPVPPATLSQTTFENAFVQEAQLFESANGAYGVPFLVDPLVLFANRTILSSDGIPQAPTTWEALTGLVPKVATLTQTGALTRFLVALGTYSNVHDARGILSALFLQTGVPITVTSQVGYTTASLSGNSQSGEPAGQAVLRFYTQFADPSKVSYTWDASQPDSEQAFVAGDSALYIGYASEAKYLAQANPNLNFSVSALPQPQTATVKTTYGLVYAFAVPRGATNPTGGYQFAALLSNSAQQQVAANALGLAPASIAALGTLPGDPVLDVAYASALYARGWLSPAPTDTDRVFSSMINNVISGSLTLQTALAGAEQSLTALMQ